MKRRVIILFAALTALLLLLSCKNDDEEQTPGQQTPPAGYARVSGNVRSASGSVSSAQIHVIYEPEYLPAGDVVFHPTIPMGPQDSTVCVTLAHSHSSIIVSVGPLGDSYIVAGGLRPLVTASSGCSGACPACSSYVWIGDYAGPWELAFSGGAYYYRQPIVLPESSTQGCVTLHFEYILSSLCCDPLFIPCDNAVEVRWYTYSESGLDHFEIERDHAVIGSVTASNTPEGHDYLYRDNTAQNGSTYLYGLAMIELSGARTVVAIDSVTLLVPPLPMEYVLHPNYPNPLQDSTVIGFDLPQAEMVTLKVCTKAGDELVSLVEGQRAAGRHSVLCDLSGFANGLYESRMTAGDSLQSWVLMMKNTTDIAILRTTPGASATDRSGTYSLTIATGDTVSTYDMYGGASGVARLNRVTIAALASGYLPKDTTLTLSGQSQHTVDFLLTPDH